MKPYLFGLRGYFTKYKLFNVIRLYSTYSIRIYELLKQFEKIGIRKIQLQELRQMLDIKENMFIRYYDFKRYVLLMAQKELEQKTDIKFEFKEIKKGKRVTELEFSIFRNTEYDGQITFAELDIDSTEKTLLKVESTLDDLLVKFKDKTGADIKLGALESLICAQGMELVEKYIDNWDKFNYQNINNVVGFFMQAVLNEYDIPKGSKKSMQGFKSRNYENLNDIYDNYKPNIAQNI